MTIDPLSLAGVSNAASVLAASLPGAPVWQLDPGVVHVVGYRACRSALLDPTRFSSDLTRYGPTGLGGEPAPARTMNAVDPPAHGELRSVCAGPFTRRAVDALSPELVRLADGLLDPLVEQGSFDVVRDFAGPYVQGVLASVLGLSPGRETDLQHWSDTITAPNGRHEVERARRELKELFAELAARPSELPAGSLLRTLRSAYDDGLLSWEQLLATCVLLVVAGAETTRNLVSSTVLTMAEQGDLIVALRQSPHAAMAVTDEALRLHSSVAAAVRYTTRDTSLAGVPIRGGCPMFIWLGAANRDPAEFDDPDTFVVERTRRQHLALGAGPHVCLGAHLARIEISTALVALARRVDRLEIDGSVIWLPSPLARGPQQARVICTPPERRAGA